LGNPGATPPDYTTGEEQCEGLDPALNFWHFVVIPNSGAGSFLSITLVLNNGSGDTSFTFSGDDLVPNGDQTDNIFVAVPAGYQLDDIVSGTAVISGTGRVFNLSHTCTAGFAPLTASKTAVASYDTNFHWTLEKTVDPTSHSGTAGEVAGDSDWTITATQVIDPNTDFKVGGTITINNSNAVAVPVTVTDVLNDGTVADVVCPAPSVPASGSLVCTYSAVPADASATLNTATITSGNANIGGAVATAPVAFVVEDANGDDPVVLTDPHLGLDESTSSSIVRTINEEFPCSSVATDYTDGAYSYTVPNTAFLDGGETHLTASAEVVVDCTLPALLVSKTAEGNFDRRVDWTLDKSVDIPSFTGVPGQSFLDFWNIDVTRTVTNENFAVSGTVTIINDASIDQAFLASDVLDTGEAVTLDCGGATSVPAHGNVVCTYDQSVADDAATLNTVTVTAPGNSPIEATAPIDFTGTFTGDLVTDLTDPRLPVINTLGLDLSTDRTVPETFTCPASDSGLYVNGTYTETFVNTAFLDGATVHLTDSASVVLTCNLRRVSGGHTIGYFFNAPAGQALTLANFPALKTQYPNVLGSLSFANKTVLKNFGNGANCSGTCTTLLQAQFTATAMQVRLDTTAPFYGDQCVAVPTYIEADGVAQIDDLLTRINVLWPTLTTAQRVELQALLNGINNDAVFNLC
jgi:hypothetical protein